jgi:hypothetical protein
MIEHDNKERKMGKMSLTGVAVIVGTLAIAAAMLIPSLG